MRCSLSLVLLFAMTTSAAAQVSDVAVPNLVFEIGDVSVGPIEDDTLDLANIVQSAAKGVTTVQEAPVIVTVITADNIGGMEQATRHLTGLGHRKIAFIGAPPSYTPAAVRAEGFRRGCAAAA